jgi:hypothetical protein
MCYSKLTRLGASLNQGPLPRTPDILRQPICVRSPPRPCEKFRLSLLSEALDKAGDYGAPVVDRRQSQQPARLRTILRSSRRRPKRTGVKIIPNPSIQIDQYPTLPCPSVLPPISRRHGIVVQPGGGQTQIARAVSVQELAKSSGQNAQEILYAVGHIEYNDIFPGTITHTVEWCVIISPEDIAKGLASQFNVSIEAK